MMVLVFAWVGAGANEERECIRYAPPQLLPSLQNVSIQNGYQCQGIPVIWERGGLTLEKLGTMNGRITYFQMQNMLQLKGNMGCARAWEVRWGMGSRPE